MGRAQLSGVCGPHAGLSPHALALGQSGTYSGDLVFRPVADWKPTEAAEGRLEPMTPPVSSARSPREGKPVAGPILEGEGQGTPPGPRGDSRTLQARAACQNFIVKHTSASGVMKHMLSTDEI